MHHPHPPYANFRPYSTSAQWACAGAAVLTVFLAVMLHAPRPVKDATVARADALLKAEQMVAQQNWSGAVAVAQQYLAQYPQERRLRFVLGKSLAGLGNADQSLLQLAMSATRPLDGERSGVLGSPSCDEIRQAVEQLESKAGELKSDWAHLRKARVSAACGDSEKRDRELAAIPETAPAPIDAEQVCRRDVVTGLLGSIVSATAQQSVMRMIKVHQFSLPLGSITGPDFTVVAGGTYTGLEHRIYLGESTQRSYPVDGWWFLTLDEQHALVEEKKFDLSPLSRDGASLKQWFEGLPQQATVIAMVSGETLLHSSSESRTLLTGLAGLTMPGRPESLCAYVFVLAPSGSGCTVREAVSSAPDVPVVVSIEKGA